MKISEFKLKTLNGINSLIDTYFNGQDIKDKFINATLKVIVKQNINKYDKFLDLLANESGEIEIMDIIEEYTKIFDDNGFVFDLRDYIDNDIIKTILPNKALIVNRSDIENIYR